MSSYKENIEQVYTNMHWQHMCFLPWPAKKHVTTLHTLDTITEDIQKGNI